MDWSLLVFLVVILFFAYRGFRKGLLKSIARILSVVAGYACAILYSKQVSGIIESELQLQGILALIAASLLLFFGASILVGLLFWLLEKLLAGDGSVSTASSIGGAVVGLGTGLLLAIVVVWAVAFIRDARPLESPGSSVAKEPSKIETLANRAAGKAVASAMSLGSASPEVAKISAALAESPAEVVQRAQRLAQSEDLSALLNDPRSRVALDSGDPEAVRKLPAFQQLINNPDLQALANATGLTDEAAAENQPMDVALATRVTDIWARTQRAKNDPRVQAILADAAFQQSIRSGNPLDLLGNEKLLEMADIIFSDEAAPASVEQGARSGQSGSVLQPAENVKKLYKWTDDSGRTYYSDVKPDS
ncbi:MAG: hypothetical protein GWP56_10625 [Gammaproteobacteria bacterium]|jgi:hypothetical protein|nr:hypothetical protein [Gammaproteobacteria bacterium]